MADVILDTVERFDQKHLYRRGRMISDELATLIREGYNALGRTRVYSIVRGIPALPLGR